MLDNVAENSKCIKRIFTGDGAWVYEYDIENV